MMNRAFYYLLFLLLPALTCCTNEAERTRMRSGLDSLNVRNRTDLPFTPAGVQPYVDFFDRHGTANDQLLAHYLMGRAYHEQGETPMALQYYQQAAECADTTAADCDYAQLSRVYGQMATIYHEHRAIQMELTAQKTAEKIAWLAKDTLNALILHLNLTRSYYYLGEKDSALIISTETSQKLSDYGQPQLSSQALATAIDIWLERKEIDKAKYGLRAVETKSGIVDQNGEARNGYEYYYSFKGRYYEEINRMDSALFYYYKLLCTPNINNYEEAYKRLMNVYDKIKEPDSVRKYAILFTLLNDSASLSQSSEEIIRMQSIYNYSRHQKIAAQKSEEARKEKERRNTIVVVFVLFVLLCTALLYRLYRNGKIRLERYRQSLVELQELRTEKRALDQHAVEYAKLISKKQQEIDNLEKNISKYGKLIYFNTANAERCLKGSATYQEIEHMAIKGQFLSEKEWVTIINLIKEYLPGFDDYITTYRHLLKDDEYRICLLLRLHFKPVDIAGMAGLSKSLISQRSTEIVRKLFQEKGSSKELSNKLAKIF